MQAIEFSEPGVIRMIDLPESSAPGPGEALVRTHRMGICGTDLACHLGRFPFFEFPRTPGHELGLEVVALGAGVVNVKVGDKCSLEPYLNDEESFASRAGHSNCCPGVKVVGVHMDGGLRQGGFLVPARKLHPGNDLTYDQLALVETLAIGCHAVDRGAPQVGETVVVIGAGPIGLSCLEFLKLLEVRVIVLDLSESRLRFCRETLGIQETIRVMPDASHLAEYEQMTSGLGANLVIDATGNAGSMSACLGLAGFAGRVVYVGITTSELRFAHAPVFHRRELTLLASRNALPRDFTRIISLVREGAIRTDPWITHRLAFDAVPHGFQQFTDPALGAIKCLIDVHDGA